jgi:hypothetical protein
MISQREWLLARFDFYRCPNSERISACVKDSADDKLMCGCGQVNPIVKGRGYSEPMTSGTVHHRVRDLSPASVDEFMVWMEKWTELIKSRRGAL